MDDSDHAKHEQWRGDLRAFRKEAKEHWVGIVGGSFVFIILGAVASAGFDVPKLVSGIGAFCLAVSWACFLAFRGERRRWELADKKLADIQDDSKARFSESVDRARIVFGNGLINEIPIDGERHVLLGLNKEDAICGIVIDGRLQIDATVFAGEGLAPMKIRSNRLHGRPPGWDKNQNDNALEIVNPSGVPVFQLIYTDDHSAILKGIFIGGGGIMLLHDKGASTKAKDYTVTPIFKYPSWKFSGQLNDSDAIKTVESKSVKTPHNPRVTWEEKNQIIKIFKDAPNVTVTTTAVVGEDFRPSGEAACWFYLALKEAGVTTVTPNQFGNAETLPEGVSIFWKKTPENNDMANRIISAARVKGYFCREVDRSIFPDAEITLMFGVNPTRPSSNPDK